MATIGWEGLILEDALREDSKSSKNPKNRISGEGRRPDMNVLEYHSSDVDAK